MRRQEVLAEPGKSLEEEARAFGGDELCILTHARVRGSRSLLGKTGKNFMDGLVSL